MKSIHGIVFVSSLFLLCALQTNCVVGRGLSTPGERATALDIARSLEQDPLAKDAPAKRQWLLKWMIEVPDIRFKSCVRLLDPDVGNQYRYSAEVNQQITFSAAAFTLEHPDLRNDRDAYTAGLEGALRVYETLVKSAPDAKLSFLDDLVTKRDQGALADHVAKLVKEKCKKSNTALILNLGGAGVGLLLALIVARWFGGRPLSHVTGPGGIAPENGGAKIARIVRQAAFLSVAYFMTVILVLHFIEPGFDPRFRFMSEYALGNYGWLMTSAFFALGLAPFVVAVGLRHVWQSSWGARIGFGLLTVAALFVWLAGIFKDSVPHLLASVVALPSILMAVLVLSWTFRQAVGWQNIYRVTLVIAIGMIAAFLSMVADIGMPGLQQRVFIFLFLLWLSIVVIRLTRRTAVP